MQLLGREISVSEGKRDAAVMTGLFAGIGAENAVRFKEGFFEKYGDLDSALESVNQASSPYLSDAIKKANEVLKNNGVDTFDIKALTGYLNEKGAFDLWNDCLKEFRQKSMELGNGAAEGEGTDAHAAARAQVYELLKQYLPKALSDTTKGFALVLMPLITEKNGHVYEPVTEEDEVKSKELYDSVIAGKVAESKRTDTIFEAISLNPCNADAFYYFVLKYGDSDGEIEKAGELFGNPIRKMKLDGFVSYERKALDQKMPGLDGLSDEAYVKELETIKRGFANIKKNMGISPDVVTDPEKRLQEALLSFAGAGDDAAEGEAQPQEQVETPVVTDTAEEKPQADSGAAVLQLQEPVETTVVAEAAEVALSPKMQAVKDICAGFKKASSVPGLYEPSKKLIKHLELEDGEEIFMGQDKTLLGSGKEGFALTSHCIICVTGKVPSRMTYEELASASTLEWANPDFKFELLADDDTIIRCLPSEKDDILGLMNSIREALQ